MNSSRKFVSRIQWCDKSRTIGTFYAHKQASAAYLSVQESLARIKSPTLSADEVNAAFDAAIKKALKAYLDNATLERGPPIGVRKCLSGRFESHTCWGGKTRLIGAFDTFKQASAAYVSVRENLGDAKLSPLQKSEKVLRITFDAAKKKALETVYAMVVSDG